MDTDMSKREAEEIIGEAEKKPFVADSASGESSHAVNEGAKASDVAAETALSNKPVLYHIQHYSSSTPWIVIEELGIKDKIRIQECKNDEHKTGEAGAHNPHGFIPLFKTEDGEYLIESGAIAMHLIEKYGGENPALFGKPEQRLKLLQWIFYGPATLYPMIAPVYDPAVKADEARVNKMRENVDKKAFPLIAAALREDDTGYLLGDQFTLADIMVGYMLVGAKHVDWLDPATHPKVSAYVDRLMERPSFQAAFS